MLRALGLLEGDVDLFDQVNDLNSAGIVGYYSYEDERIRVRGKELTPAVQSTLVHELTHALQDQHFDLEKMKKNAEDDSSAASSLDALIEGDARRIETEWRQGLGTAEQKALDKDTKAQSDGAQSALSKVPEVMQTLISAPYVFGEAMLAVATEEGGDGAVDDLFENPPTTDEHQLDPWTLIADHSVPIPVDTPKLDAGEKEFDDGPFGSVAWLLLLAERIPVEQALTAADGWGGDAYVAYEKNDRSLRADRLPRGHRGGRHADAGRPARMGGQGAEEPGQRLRGRLRACCSQSCDPGPKAKHVATESSEEAVALALSRTYLSDDPRQVRPADRAGAVQLGPARPAPHPEAAQRPEGRPGPRAPDHRALPAADLGSAP